MSGLNPGVRIGDRFRINLNVQMNGESSIWANGAVVQLASRWFRIRTDEHGYCVCFFYDDLTDRRQIRALTERRNVRANE